MQIPVVINSFPIKVALAILIFLVGFLPYSLLNKDSLNFSVMPYLIILKKISWSFADWTLTDRREKLIQMKAQAWRAGEDGVLGLCQTVPSLLDLEWEKSFLPFRLK